MSQGFRRRPADPEAARELGQACGLSVTAAQLLIQRGFDDAHRARAFLTPRLQELTPPNEMADREVAADRVARAIREHEHIAVFGDYDVDGITSAVIFSDIIEALGGHVSCLVADRFRGGYGFSDPALDRCLEAGAQLIVTCDCGSSDHERIARARDKGIDIVVIDHHRVPNEPLPALAFVNPHRPDCGFGYKGLASAGLVLSLGAALRASLQKSLDLRQWLDLVALGTIADIAPLDGDNRCLVRAGLERLGLAEARPGVVALRELTRLPAGQAVRASDVAFRLAPRLNAAGRLGEADLTKSLLRERNLPAARALAGRIEQLNEQRKKLGQQATEQAVQQVERMYGSQPASGVVVADEGWHRGVVGIVAARLVDRFGVPAVVCAVDDGFGHGSGRTPQGFDLHQAVSHCEDLLVRFGGHRAAIGLTIEASRLETFRAAFSDASQDVSGPLPGPLVDVSLDGVLFTLPTSEEMAGLEPLGEANAEPLFALENVSVENSKVVGGDHLRFDVRLGRQRLRAFAPNGAGLCLVPGARSTVLGHLRPDLWRQAGALEVHVVDVSQA